MRKEPIAQFESELLAKGWRFWHGEEQSGRTHRDFWIFKKGRDQGWLHGSSDSPAVVVTDLKTGIRYRQEWRVMRLDRDDGPARIQWDKNTGALLQEDWFLSGRLHRLGGPAVTKYDRLTGAVTYEGFYERGKKLSELFHPENESPPAPRMRAARARYAGVRERKLAPG
jgi:hypothetical protein